MNLRLFMAMVLLLVAVGVAGAVEPPPATDPSVFCVLTSPAPPFENYLQNVSAGTPFTMYFVLYNPNVPSGFIGAADFGWAFDPAPTGVIMEAAGPAGTLNIGTGQEPILGFGVPVPVIDGHALLFHVQYVFLVNPNPTALYLHANALAPSLPGQLAYVDAQDQILQSMQPYSENNSLSSPVFGVNYQPIAAESATWSGVKALFD